jgi:ligand-binding SRPBCC domain-containing protein
MSQASTSIRLTFTSPLRVPPQQAWSWATSIAGISAELRPWMKMTVPKGVANIVDLDVRLGQPLCRSWILLFGVLPIDRSALTLIELDNGRRFLEQSPMVSMRLWRHERTIESQGSGCVLTDRLEFQPRVAAGVVRWFIATLFAHRHAVIRRNLGGA